MSKAAFVFVWIFESWDPGTDGERKHEKKVLRGGDFNSTIKASFEPISNKTAVKQVSAWEFSSHALVEMSHGLRRPMEPFRPVENFRSKPVEQTRPICHHP